MKGMPIASISRISPWSITQIPLFPLFFLPKSYPFSQKKNNVSPPKKREILFGIGWKERKSLQSTNSHRDRSLIFFYQKGSFCCRQKYFFFLPKKLLFTYVWNRRQSPRPANFHPDRTLKISRLYNRLSIRLECRGIDHFCCDDLESWWWWIDSVELWWGAVHPIHIWRNTI